MQPDIYNQPNKVINKKVLLIVFAIFLVICIILALFLLSKHSNEKVNPTPINYQDNFFTGISSVSPDINNPEVIHLFNGRNFIKYNLKTKQSSRRIKDVNLPNSVSEMKWSKDKNYVSFKASGFTTNDELGKYLNNMGLSLNNHYFWVMNTNTGEFNLISGSYTLEEDSLKETLFTTWGVDPNKIIFVTKVGDTSEIYLYDVIKKETKLLFKNSNLVLYLSQLNPNKYIILESKQDGSILEVNDIDSTGKSKLITKVNSNIINTSPDGKYFYIFEPSNASKISDGENTEPISGKLNIYNSDNNKIVKDINNLKTSDFFSWSGNSKSIYTFTNSSKLSIVNVDNSSSTIFKPLDKINLRNSGAYQFIASGIEGLVFIVNKDGVNTIQTPDIQRPYTVNLNTIQTPDNFTDFNVSYDDKYKLTTVSLYKQPYDLFRQKAIEYVGNKGVNPDLIPINFINFNPANNNYHGR